MFFESIGPGLTFLVTAIILDILDLWLIVVPPLSSNSFLIFLGVSTILIGYMNEKSPSRPLTLVCSTLHATTGLLVIHSLWTYTGMLSTCHSIKTPFCKQMVAYAFPTGLILMSTGISISSLYFYCAYKLFRNQRSEIKTAAMPDAMLPDAVVMGQPTKDKNRVF